MPNTFDLAVVPLQERIVAGARRALSVLLAAVLFVLLVASVNIADLLLARASARQKEIAIRATLGAGRTRLLRQFLAEGIVLSLMGGAAGLLLAKVGVMLILGLAPHALPRLIETSIDGCVLAFCIGTSLVSTLLLGFVPAISVWKIGVHKTLKEGARTASPNVRSLRIREILIASELALAIVLLTGAGLMLKSYWRMNAHAPGFDPDHILVVKQYRDVMGFRVVKGRWITDAERQPVVAINEALARRDFAGRDPLGEYVEVAGRHLHRARVRGPRGRRRLLASCLTSGIPNSTKSLRRRSLSPMLIPHPSSEQEQCWYTQWLIHCRLLLRSERLSQMWT